MPFRSHNSIRNSCGAVFGEPTFRRTTTTANGLVVDTETKLNEKLADPACFDLDTQLKAGVRLEDTIKLAHGCANVTNLPTPTPKKENE